MEGLPATCYEIFLLPCLNNLAAASIILKAIYKKTTHTNMPRPVVDTKIQNV
jgi:hypothetical protein